MRELKALNRWHDQICRLDPEAFLAHVTVAYFADGMCPEEDTGLVDILRPYERWNARTLTVDRVELRCFQNMQQWSGGLEAVALRNQGP